MKQYKNSTKSLSQIASELNVDAVLEGAILRSGNQIRITAELIKVPTERHLWANEYDGDLKNVLTLESTVAQTIAREIKTNIAPDTEKKISSSQHVDPEAYELYLKGRYFLNQVTQEGLKKSIDYFQKAIAKDSSFALPYAGMSDSFIVAGNWGFIPEKEAFPKAKESAEKALQIDSRLGDSYAPLAFVKCFYDWNWKGAGDDFKMALVLNPNNSETHLWYTLYLRSEGRFEEAIAEAKAGRQLDPLSPIINMTVGSTYYWAHQYDVSITELLKTVELAPTFRPVHSYLARAYLQNGMLQKARTESALSGEEKDYIVLILAVSGNRKEALRELYKEKGEEAVDPYFAAVVYAALHDTNQVIRLLEKAYQQHSTALTDVNIDPFFASLHSDPRFVDLLRRIGIPQ